MSLPTTCQRKRDGQECGRPATVIPAIDLYAPGVATPATMLLGLPHCDDCAAAATLGDMVADSNWREFSAAFRAVRMTPPVRELSVLRWHHVAGEVVKAWQQAVEATAARAAAVRRHTDN